MFLYEKQEGLWQFEQLQEGKWYYLLHKYRQKTYIKSHFSCFCEA